MIATASCSFFAAFFFGQACWPQPLVAHPQHHHVAAIHQHHFAHRATGNHIAVIPLPTPSPLKKEAAAPAKPTDDLDLAWHIPCIKAEDMGVSGCQLIANQFAYRV